MTPDSLNDSTQALANDSDGDSVTLSVSGPVISSLLCLICVLGVGSNLHILLVTWSHLRTRSSLYVHIVSLAVADLLHLSIVPFVVHGSLSRDWAFGGLGCKLVLAQDLTAMQASAFTLTALACERCLSVVRPFRARRGPGPRAVFAALASWSAGALLALPLAAGVHVEEAGDPRRGRLCVLAWAGPAERAYLACLFATGVALPGLALLGLYSTLARAYLTSRLSGLPHSSGRASRRVLSSLALLVLAFWAGFGPFWVWQLILAQDRPPPGTPSSQGLVNGLLTCLTFANSALNPLLYTLLSRNYREYLRARRGRGPGFSTHQAGPLGLPQGPRQGLATSRGL